MDVSPTSLFKNAKFQHNGTQNLQIVSLTFINVAVRYLGLFLSYTCMGPRTKSICWSCRRAKSGWNSCDTLCDAGETVERRDDVET